MPKMSTRARIEFLAKRITVYGSAITLERHSPGDGWTRYDVGMGGIRLANSMNANECERFLDGILQTLALLHNNKEVFAAQKFPASLRNVVPDELQKRQIEQRCKRTGESWSMSRGFYSDSPQASADFPYNG